jgi:periplasmic divalent cation tolerance protein
MSEYCSLYVTFPNREEAHSIAHTLLAEKLVACANIIDGMTSLYHWLGELQTEKEVVMFAKTSAVQREAAMTRIKALHSYEVPCIVALPIEAAQPDFLRWIDQSTKA